MRLLYWSIKERALYFGLGRTTGQIVRKNVMPHSFKREKIALRLNVMSKFTKTLGTNAIELECVGAILTPYYQRGINRLTKCF